MNIVNILAETAVSQKFIDFAVDPIASKTLGWLETVISWIFNLFSDVRFGVALGVIVFTLILKTIVLPLDVYSRVKSKKQALIMEKMRPQMEKLQQQYANDKDTYNQKALEIQKANGYNPLAACLPMVVSLIIFIGVFSSFSFYSNYANLDVYNHMVYEYNTTGVSRFVQTDENDEKNEHFLIDCGEDGYRINYDKFSAYYSEEYGENAFSDDMDEDDKNAKVAEVVHLNAREASADWYVKNREKTSFLWIGNVWYPDSMLNKEMPDFQNFSSSVQRAVDGMVSNYRESYDEVTYNLSKEKETFNGFFVLIALAIGLMLLQQFITMRSQKAANELSTVDGSAAATNKWMMVMMPIIYGVFSFFYSAAFSLYMIVNTVYGLISMLIINKIVSVRFDKAESMKARAGQNNRKRLK